MPPHGELHLPGLRHLGRLHALGPLPQFQGQPLRVEGLFVEHGIGDFHFLDQVAMQEDALVALPSCQHTRFRRRGAFAYIGDIAHLHAYAEGVIKSGRQGYFHAFAVVALDLNNHRLSSQELKTLEELEEVTPSVIGIARVIGQFLELGEVVRLIRIGGGYNRVAEVEGGRGLRRGAFGRGRHGEFRARIALRKKLRFRGGSNRS